MHYSFAFLLEHFQILFIHDQQRIQKLVFFGRGKLNLKFLSFYLHENFVSHLYYTYYNLKLTDV